MNAWKKGLGIFMGILLAGSLILTACSSNENDPESSSTSPINGQEDANADGNNTGDGAASGELQLPLTDTPITYNYFIEERADAAVKDDWLSATEIATRTGVKLKFEPTPQAGFAEKKQILIATHSVPDIVSGLTATEGRQYGPDGVFLDFKPYMERGLMPNITRWYEEYTDMATVSTAADGGIYAIPTLGTEPWFSFALMGRQDLLDEYGLEAPTNTDEFYNVLKKLKEHHPDSYPFTTRVLELNHNAGIFNIFTRAFTEVSRVLGYNPISGQYEFAAERPEFIDMLHYLHKLYSEQLLDQEFALMNSNLWEERILTNKSFFTYDSKPRYYLFTDMAKNLDSNTSFDMKPVMELVAPGKQVYTLASANVNATKNNIALSSKVSNPEIAVQFIDYLYSEDAIELLELGVEGITYELVNGKPRYLDNLEDPIGITLRRDFGLRYDTGFLGVSIGLGRSAEGYYEGPAVIVEEMYADIVRDPAPVVLVTEEESDLEKDKLPVVEQFMIEKLTQFVMGRLPITEQSLAEFVSEANRLGAKELVEMYNGQLKRIQ